MRTYQWYWAQGYHKWCSNLYEGDFEFYSKTRPTWIYLSIVCDDWMDLWCAQMNFHNSFENKNLMHVMIGASCCQIGHQSSDRLFISIVRPIEEVQRYFGMIIYSRTSSLSLTKSNWHLFLNWLHFSCSLSTTMALELVEEYTSNMS